MSGAPELNLDEPRFQAAVAMVRRTGAQQFQLRYQDDEEPVVWLAVARYGVDEQGHPIADGGEPAFKVGAAFNPLRAVLRLCEDAVDGATCKHCDRPTGLEPDWLDTMPLNAAVCWYQYDPELQTFRRGCE